MNNIDWSGCCETMSELKPRLKQQYKKKLTLSGHRKAGQWYSGSFPDSSSSAVAPPSPLHYFIIIFASYCAQRCLYHSTITRSSLSSHQHLFHLNQPFYLHSVLPVLLWLLTRPLHSDCESIQDYCSAVLIYDFYLMHSFYSSHLPVCIPMQPLQQLWDKLMGVLLVPSSKFYLELPHRWFEVRRCDGLVLGGPECLQNLQWICNLILDMWV